MAALHRVCFENTLFLPTFPISDMSDLEIEKAAMGPRRWIELCSAFQKQGLDDNGVILRPQSTRTINDSLAIKVNYHHSLFFLVLGGRFLVTYSAAGISVLDLGYTSSSDCKLIATVEPPMKGGSIGLMVSTTPDGKGLTIFSSLDG